MKKLICIECPKGCNLSISENLEVSGNSCPRGKVYAINELTNPKRILTSTVKISGSFISRLPVISSESIPKDKLFDVMNAINSIEVKAPINIHEVIISDVCNLGVDIIATRSLKKNN